MLENRGFWEENDDEEEPTKHRSSSRGVSFAASERAAETTSMSIKAFSVRPDGMAANQRLAICDLDRREEHAEAMRFDAPAIGDPISRAISSRQNTLN